MTSTYLIFLLLYLSVHSVIADHCDDYSQRQNRLTLGVLVPDHFQSTIGASIELALKHVHSTPNLMPDYCIDLLYRDTQCKTSVGMKSLFDLMNAERKPIALFGGMQWPRNTGTFFNSHTPKHMLNSRQRTPNELYPTFYRIVPGDRNLNAARAHLLQHYNWTRVGTVKQSDKPRYALPHESLTTLLENPYAIKVVYTAGVSSDQIKHIGFQLDELKRRDAHIIVADMSPSLALHVLCEAYVRELYGADYVWILPGYHEPNWWQQTDSTNCSQDQIEEILQHHWTVEFAPYRPDFTHSIVSNHSVTEVRSSMEGYCTREAKCDQNIYGTYAYDGIWSLALALNASLYDEEGPQGYEESAERTASRLLTYMGRNAFDGVTGKVKFEHNERLGLVFIYQWHNGSYHQMGYYDSADNVFELSEDDDWNPPLDATVVVRQLQYVNFLLLGAMCSIALVGVIMALLFLFINIKYRNHKFIKMSSPNMNNLIIIGSICAYVSIFLLGIDTRFVSPKSFERLCYTKTWVLSVGFTLAFGSMFSKTWRVHSIFTNIRKDKKAIKDAQLFMIVALLLLIDGIILGAWSLISPFQFQVTEHEAVRVKNQLIIPRLEKCQSNYSIFFQVIFYIIKGMLMIFGCFLAWETRAVNVPALNDSKHVRLQCCRDERNWRFFGEKINEAFLLTSFFIIFCTTLTLSLVFVPKVVELFRTPRGTDSQRYRKGMMKSVVGKNSGEKLHRQLSIRISEGIKEKIAAIEVENLKLHQVLITRSAELWDLLERLRVLGGSDEKLVKGSASKSSNLCCVSNSSTEPTSSSHYEIATTNDPQNSTSSSCKTDTFSSLFYRTSTGKSLIVKQKTDGLPWLDPWLDPSQPSTML
ncbi:Gamma aminobutyric acid type b receptor subunit 2 [Aphelenchoides bicaudatus]|nr:Gamma aminobutyric acid type b receptor subunit 2 [Aphelenchoides bicaudatus]